jgi:hypothetical protein
MEGLSMEDVGIFNGHLVYFVAICGNFVYFSPVLVCCTKKQLATLGGGKKSILFDTPAYEKTKLMFYSEV